MRQIDTACEKIRESKNLKDILEIILAVGNYMNDSSKQANGFKLGTLQRLAFTKDDKNTMTFLHYVEKIVRTSFPDLENFSDDLKDAIDASKLSIDQLKSDGEEFMQSIKNVQTSVDIGNLSDPTKFHPQDKVLSVVLSALPEARKKRDFISDHMKTTVAEFNKLMKYFGEDPSDNTAASSFFSKFAFFVSEFQRAKQENLQREQETRAYEAQKRLREAPKKSSQLESGNLSGSSSPGGQNGDQSAANNSVMDNLMEKLKAAGPSGDARSARRRAAARRTMAGHRRALLNETGGEGNDKEEDVEIKTEPAENDEEVEHDKQKASSVDLNDGGTASVNHSTDKSAEVIEITDDDGEEKANEPTPDLSQPSNDLSEPNLKEFTKDREEADESKTALERSSSVASESILPNEKEKEDHGNELAVTPEEEDDDVGGRARKLLEELRSGASGSGDYKRPGSLSSSSGGSKLAERRARKVQQLKNRSQGSFDLKALKSEAAPSPLSSPEKKAEERSENLSPTKPSKNDDATAIEESNEVIEIEDTPVNSPDKEEQESTPTMTTNINETEQ